MSKQKSSSSAQAETGEQLRPPSNGDGSENAAVVHPTVEQLAAQVPRSTPIGLVAAAARLHGWSEHRHATGQPMRMAAVDFEAALKTTLKPGKASPHLPAASEHRSKTGS